MSAMRARSPRCRGRSTARRSCTKKSTVAKLTPTGNVDAPYALTIITNAVGCVDQRLMTMGEVGGHARDSVRRHQRGLRADRAGRHRVHLGAHRRGAARPDDRAGPGPADLRPARAHAVSANVARAAVDQRQLSQLHVRLLQAALGRVRARRVEGRLDSRACSQLGIDTVLGGGGMRDPQRLLRGAERRAPLVSLRRGQRRARRRSPVAAGRRCSTSTSRSRRRCATARCSSPGYKATVGCPTVYFCNPMGGIADGSVGTLTLTATYMRDFKEERVQTRGVAADRVRQPHRRRCLHIRRHSKRRRRRARFSADDALRGHAVCVAGDAVGGVRGGALSSRRRRWRSDHACDGSIWCGSSRQRPPTNCASLQTQLNALPLRDAQTAA